MKIGIESEGWGTPPEKELMFYGAITRDASPDLTELIGNPADDLDRAIKNVRVLASEAADGDQQMIYSYRRPPQLSDGVWRDNDRYRTVVAALAQECSETWRGVNRMTEFASTHVNVGVDWQTPAGVTLLSLLNNIGPKVSTVLQQRHNIPHTGQLALWHGWADPRRLPGPDRWWDTLQDLETHYGRVPCLIKDGPNGVEIDRSLGSGSLDNAYHLGTMWLLARPKINPKGVRYIETRLLGSIDPRGSDFEDIVASLVTLVSDIVSCASTGCVRKDTPDLLSDLRTRGHDHLPEQLLTWEDWAGCTAWNLPAPQE